MTRAQKLKNITTIINLVIPIFIFNIFAISALNDFGLTEYSTIRQHNFANIKCLYVYNIVILYANIVIEKLNFCDILFSQKIAKICEIYTLVKISCFTVLTVDH